jgi:hypothetical protein
MQKVNPEYCHFSFQKDEKWCREVHVPMSRTNNVENSRGKVASTHKSWSSWMSKVGIHII